MYISRQDIMYKSCFTGAISCKATLKSLWQIGYQFLYCLKSETREILKSIFHNFYSSDRVAPARGRMK